MTKDTNKPTPQEVINDFQWQFVHNRAERAAYREKQRSDVIKVYFESPRRVLDLKLMNAGLRGLPSRIRRRTYE